MFKKNNIKKIKREDFKINESEKYFIFIKIKDKLIVFYNIKEYI